MSLDAWAMLRMEEFKATGEAFRAQPGYAALASEAAALGYRPITLWEQMSAKADAYSWRGGVWVKK